MCVCIYMCVCICVYTICVCIYVSIYCINDICSEQISLNGCFINVKENVKEILFI